MTIVDIVKGILCKKVRELKEEWLCLEGQLLELGMKVGELRGIVAITSLEERIEVAKMRREYFRFLNAQRR